MIERIAIPDSGSIEKGWPLQSRVPFEARYNVARPSVVPVIGLSPAGALDLAEGRWEGEKPPREASVRCLVPALGWYEWRYRGPEDAVADPGDEDAQPFFLKPKVGATACFGALQTPSGDGGRPLIFLLADALTGKPVLVHRDRCKGWLEGAAGASSDDEIERIPVGSLVDDPAMEGPELIRPVQLWPHRPTGTKAIPRRI